jgi:nucleotidyltransferase/DNA polymerase involved in DNA repair
VEEEAISDLRWELRLALQDISPMVEWVDDTLAYLDAGARDLRWPTEAALASQLGREVQRLLLVPPQVGVGQSRFTARAAALAADPGRARLVPPGGAPHFLAELPVEVLPLPGAVKERLREFGLTTCGDCAAIPLPLLQRQFGPEGLLLNRLCLGRDGATVNHWVAPPPCGVRRVLAGPVEDTEALRFGAPELAAELAVELAQRNLAAGRLRLLVGGEGGESWELISPPSPAMTKEELLPLVLSLMARVRRPVEVVEIQALDLVAPPVRQRQLFPTGGDRREEIERAAARLSERFGGGLVWQVAVRPEHPGDVPEERLAWHRA